MNILHISKGSPGYMKKKRIREIILTAALFAVSASLYFAGIKATGSNKNLLTIVAVLGCLPASKSAINMIMFLRYKGCSEETADRLKGTYANFYILYDMVFTSYEKNYEIHHMAINDHVICAYTESLKCDIKGCEKHLEKMLVQNGIKNVTVKIFKDIPKYKNRLVQLEQLDKPGTAADSIKQLMLEISL